MKKAFIFIFVFLIVISCSKTKTNENVISETAEELFSQSYETDYSGESFSSNPDQSSAFDTLPTNVPDQNGFVRINGGTFTMGTNDYANYGSHQVTVSSFYMGRYEVTQKEYQEVMKTNPSFFVGDNLPVECVTWFDAVEYCNRKSQREGLTPAYTISGSGDDRTVTWNRNSNGYRLPTEAEWEYTCRAGTTTPYYSGNSVDNAGWHEGNSGEKTNAVGAKQPNAWGLYDMHGNVYEWCWDWAGKYSSEAQTNPTGVSSGSRRVCRGGSWFSSALGTRSATRYLYSPDDGFIDIGFRVARNAE